MTAGKLVCYTAVFSVVTQRSSPPPNSRWWGGALRDDSKNGCVADYRQTSKLKNKGVVIYVGSFLIVHNPLFFVPNCDRINQCHVSIGH